MTLTKKESLRQSLWLAFGIPVGLMLLVMLIAGAEPFRGGDVSMLYSDMYHQYFPFWVEFGRAIRNGDGLLWNWSAGMGMDYLSLISYYLASPLNLISVIVPESLALEVYSLLMPVKLGLASLFFAIFLRFEVGRVNYSYFLTAFSGNLTLVQCTATFLCMINKILAFFSTHHFFMKIQKRAQKNGFGVRFALFIKLYSPSMKPPQTRTSPSYRTADCPGVKDLAEVESASFALPSPRNSTVQSIGEAWYRSLTDRAIFSPLGSVIPEKTIPEMLTVSVNGGSRDIVTWLVSGSIFLTNARAPSDIPSPFL